MSHVIKIQYESGSSTTSSSEVVQKQVVHQTHHQHQQQQQQSSSVSNEFAPLSPPHQTRGTVTTNQSVVKQRVQSMKKRQVVIHTQGGGSQKGGVSDKVAQQISQLVQEKGGLANFNELLAKGEIDLGEMMKGEGVVVKLEGGGGGGGMGRVEEEEGPAGGGAVAVRQKGEMVQQKGQAVQQVVRQQSLGQIGGTTVAQQKAQVVQQQQSLAQIGSKTVAHQGEVVQEVVQHGAAGFHEGEMVQQKGEMAKQTVRHQTVTQEGGMTVQQQGEDTRQVIQQQEVRQAPGGSTKIHVRGQVVKQQQGKTVHQVTQGGKVIQQGVQHHGIKMVQHHQVQGNRRIGISFITKHALHKKIGVTMSAPTLVGFDKFGNR